MILSWQLEMDMQIDLMKQMQDLWVGILRVLEVLALEMMTK